MKIGIFGGSFNPPHKMHKQIAIELIQKGYVHQVIYVPTGDPYQKKDLIAAKERLEMLKIMTRDQKNLFVSDYELQNHLTYTYQTLDYFQSMHPHDEIYFICGTDNLRELKTWKSYEYILSHYHLLVIQRNNDSLEKIRKDFNTPHITLCEIKTQNISSTQIRNGLKRNESLSLDSEVLAYIKKRNLYQ